MLGSLAESLVLGCGIMLAVLSPLPVTVLGTQTSFARRAAVLGQLK